MEILGNSWIELYLVCKDTESYEGKIQEYMTKAIYGIGTFMLGYL